MKKLFALLFFFAAPAFGQYTIPLATGAIGPPSLASGWTIIQDNIQITCSTGGTTCSWGTCANAISTECIAPTVAGSVWVISSIVGNTSPGLTISSASGGGGTWVKCPASACAATDASLGESIDMIYNLTGTTATNGTITVTMSGNTTGFWQMKFTEILPPPGYTASFDAAGTNDNPSCSASCTAVALTLSGTDAVYQFGELPLNPRELPGTAWSSPYFASAAAGDGIGLNITSGVAPTLATDASSSGDLFSAIAFKSSAGAFTYTGSNNFSLINYTLPTATSLGTAGQVSCSPACAALTIPSTTAGNLGVLIEGDSSGTAAKLSTVTCSGCSVVIPTGAGTCGANGGISCAYILSLPGSVVSITPTLTGTTSNAGFSWWEFHRTSGSWTLDAQSAKTQTGTSLPVSTAASCTGSNDVIIQAAAASGGISGAQYMQVGFYPGARLNLQTSSPFDPSNGALLNSTNCGAVTFPYDNGSPGTVNALTIAFK